MNIFSSDIFFIFYRNYLVFVLVTAVFQFELLSVLHSREIPSGIVSILRSQNTAVYLEVRA